MLNITYIGCPFFWQNCSTPSLSPNINDNIDKFVLSHVTCPGHTQTVGGSAAVVKAACLESRRSRAYGWRIMSHEELNFECSIVSL